MDRSPRIHISPLQNFCCEGCGKCCYTPWKVPVDNDKAKSIQKLDCFDQIQKSGYQPLNLFNGDFQIGRRDNGECRFWEGGGCEIHRESGGPGKPSVCQLFPFGLVNTPDGYFVSLSYSCPTVVADSGPPASELHEGVVRAVSAASHLSNTPLPADTAYPLTMQRKIEWSEYLRMEERIQSGFDPKSPLLSLLLQVSCILEQDETLDLNSSFSLPEAARLLPLFVSNTIGFLEYPDDAQAGNEMTAQLQSGETPDSPLLDDRKLTDFQILDPRTAQERDLVERYVRNFLHGKRLTTGPTIVTRLLMLTGALALLLFYLRQLSDDQHRRQDLERVLDIIETDLAVYRRNVQSIYLHFEELLLSFLGSAEGAH